ncbi:MAG: hypothetical protein ABJG41_09420 [Cyclobacteriaceae bacterium]
MAQSKKQIIQTTIGTVIGAVVILLLKQYFFQSPTFDKVMMKAASELNETCPIMVDSDTRLDNCIALPDNIFQYNYTLVNYTIEDLDIEILRDNLEPMLLNTVSSNPDLQMFRENGVTMAYDYKDKNGLHLLKIVIKPEMYK